MSSAKRRPGSTRRTALATHEPHVDWRDPMQTPITSVMTRNVVCAFEDFSLDTLEEMLLDRGLSGVPVVNDNDKLVGFIAMTDIVRALHDRDPSDPPDDSLEWGFHPEPEQRTVGQLMSLVAVVLPQSCTVASAVELMATRQVHRIPVVSDTGELVGIVAAGDIVRYLAGPEHEAGAAPDEPIEVSGERARLTRADHLRSVGFLAGGIAHQISNALTPMRLSLGRVVSFELSRRPYSADRLHRIELLQDVREGIAKVERLMTELKAFSHTDDRWTRAVNVTSVLEDAVGLVAHELRHRAQLVCNYNAAPMVRAKPGELRQVLLGVLVNALQSIPEGEAHLNEIRVSTGTDSDGRAVIDIADTGTGISSDVMPRIFEPFFSTRRDHDGLGLGLALCRDVIAALDGEITIDSVVGKGTTVRIVLPPCLEAIVTANQREPGAPAPEPARRRILLVDDDRPVASAIALELATHDVVVAESGREALEILRRDRSFDVILCDLMMPEVSGMDVYEALQLADPELARRIVLVTGGAFTERAREFVARVDAPVIEKPFDSERLHQVVNAVELRSHESRQRDCDMEVDVRNGRSESEHEA